MVYRLQSIVSAAVAVAVLLVVAGAAQAAVWMEYTGCEDLGDGVAMRDAWDTRPTRDIHIEGQFKWDPGLISLTAPGDWSSMVYNGPSLQLYNWQIEEGKIWDDGALIGFGITVSNPAVTQTPFHITDNPQFPNLPDLGSVIDTGTTYAPVPEPATTALLGLGGLAVLRRRRH